MVAIAEVLPGCRRALTNEMGYPRRSAERFGNIVPCGIHDADVTSIVEELPGAWDVAAVAHDLEPHLIAALAPIRARGDR